MKNYAYHIQLFFYRFLILLLVFSISRFLFYIFNFNYFNNIPFSELLTIHAAGIRFDISVLFYFNLPFLVLSIFPGGIKNHTYYQKTLFIFFISINSILLASNFIDTKFFDFEHKRLTSDIFSSVWLGNDFITLLPQFIVDFWYLILIWIAGSISIIWFYPKFNIQKINKGKFGLKLLVYQLISFLLFLALFIVGARGGLQLKPLRVIHAAQYTSAKNIPLVLNTPFTIMKTLGSRSYQAVQYFSSQELDSIYSPVIKPENLQKKEKLNVVILILESFSKEYIGALNDGIGYTPFLDSLINQSLVFTNAFANGKRSIEALPSIIAGLPALTDESYITSKYATNKLNSIPNLLESEGYYSAFFHGGQNGTMGFDQFAHVSGFHDYFGKDEYPNISDDDGNWGIYDEPYLQYFGVKLSEFTQPFFATVFTLTSHHPYEIPEKYKNKFPEGSLNIHQSIGYTDYSLKQFFNSIKEKTWYKNTVFILVADHTAQAEAPFYLTRMGNYAIPIIIFQPKTSAFHGQSHIIVQQTDILPTVMDIVGYSKPFISYGNSMLNDSIDHFAFNYINGIFQILENDTLLQFDGSNSISLFKYNSDSLSFNPIENNQANNYHIEQKMKAIIQSYSDRIRFNRLTTDPN